MAFSGTTILSGIELRQKHSFLKYFVKVNVMCNPIVIVDKKDDFIPVKCSQFVLPWDFKAILDFAPKEIDKVLISHACLM